MLIHISHLKIKKVKKIKQESNPNFKPNGLWYAPDKTWINWTKASDYPIKDQYYYVIVPKYTKLTNPDPNKVLQISNKKEFDDFVCEYGFLEKNWILINWHSVSESFGGIEIIPFLDDRRYILKKPDTIYKYQQCGLNMDNINMNFYGTWDVASGCVWNPMAINEFFNVLKN